MLIPHKQSDYGGMTMSMSMLCPLTLFVPALTLIVVTKNEREMEKIPMWVRNLAILCTVGGTGWFFYNILK